jgi:hypothetical protein
MNTTLRYIFLIIGIILILIAGVKTYFAFQRPNVASALTVDATFCALGAILCFAIFAKTGKKKSK